jgi:hypothetical protein
MKRFIVLFALGYFFVQGCRDKDVLENKISLTGYSSGSALCMHGDSIWVMGDDVGYALLLDTQFRVRDTVIITGTAQGRISKKEKADIECAEVLSDGNILWLGSGSRTSRMHGWLYNPETRDTQIIYLAPLFQQLEHSGIKEVNIEGLAVTPQQTILANRGHSGNPVNQLIFIRNNFWKYSRQLPVKIVKAGFQSEKQQGFPGITGLAYSNRKDRLIATVATEHTNSTYGDGKIGPNYIWLFNNISDRTGLFAINPDVVIPLNELSSDFEGEKIESVVILQETQDYMRLLLVSDKDNGTTMLFTVKIYERKAKKNGTMFRDL